VTPPPIGVPALFAAGVEGYDASSVKSIQAYNEDPLQELEADFGCDGNPVHAWEMVLENCSGGVGSRVSRGCSGSNLWDP
jgi:hypothetical protein